MLNAFYGAFSPACLALLGLWVVAVQIRIDDWLDSAPHRRRSYAVAMHFALPGIMSLLALVDPADPVFWRVSFAVIGLGGAVLLALVGGVPVRGRAAGGLSSSDGPAVVDQLVVAEFGTAIALFLLIGVLAVIGGRAELRAEAVLLTLLVFLGFNVAWQLLFDSRHTAQSRPPAAAQ